MIIFHLQIKNFKYYKMNKKFGFNDSFPDDEDFEFDFDSPPRKSAVSRRGIKADVSLTSSLNTGFNAQENNSSFAAASLSDLSDPPLPPARSKKSGGWAEETSSSSKISWLRRVSRSSPSKGTPKKDVKLSRDSDSDVPAIPDLDDVFEEEMATQIAKAPSVTVNRVLTYQELDNDLSRNAAFQALDGIDLRLLTKHLAPETSISEADIPWSWEILFADVASHNIELNKVDSENESKNVKYFA